MILAARLALLALAWWLTCAGFVALARWADRS